MALKDYSEKQLELLAYFIIGILCLLSLIVLVVIDLRASEDIPQIVYGGLIGVILRVAIKGFSISDFTGKGDKKK